MDGQDLDALGAANSVLLKLYLLYAAVCLSEPVFSTQPEVKDMYPLFVDSAQSIAMTPCEL